MMRLRHILLLLPFLLTGCSTPSTVETPAADPETPPAMSAPMPRLSADDAVTRKTNALLAAVDANNTDALKPMDHGAMGEIDHSQMGHGAKGKASGAMDHSQHGANPVPADGKAAFACPMHPEVTSAKPAKCPKCGMALKPKPSLPGGAGHQNHQP